mmetsp:Transcript_15608/g.23704  ORF Transcript_15608/g.23704 Transcript_15608/m.23704 type:complete len:262 (+) Transcript_15608:1741-2526(+)
MISRLAAALSGEIVEISPCHESQHSPATTRTSPAVSIWNDLDLRSRSTTDVASGRRRPQDLARSRPRACASVESRSRSRDVETTWRRRAPSKSDTSPWRPWELGAAENPMHRLREASCLLGAGFVMCSSSFTSGLNASFSIHRIKLFLPRIEGGSNLKSALLSSMTRLARPMHLRDGRNSHQLGSSNCTSLSLFLFSGLIFSPTALRVIRLLSETIDDTLLKNLFGPVDLDFFFRRCSQSESESDSSDEPSDDAGRLCRPP